MAESILKKCINDSGMSVVEVATVLGITHTHLYRLAQNTKKPSYQLLRKLEIMFGEESMRKHFG